MNNLWHSVDISKELLGVVEMPRGTRLKYELHKASGALVLDRILNMPVPANYGFIPQTLSDDGDPLDVFIFSSFAIEPLAIVKLKLERVVHCIDNGEGDAKLIATVVGDTLPWSGVEKRINETVDYLTKYKIGMNVIDVMDHKIASDVVTISRHNYLRKLNGIKTALLGGETQ